MPAQIAVAGASKWGIFKSLLGKAPMVFAFIFVAFMLVATISNAWNRYEETKDLKDLFAGVGAAVIKPIVASDYTILQNVQAFQAGGLLWHQKLLLWMSTMGAASTIYFVYKWIFLGGVLKLFSKEMNPDFSIYLLSLILIIGASSLYNTAHACNQFVVGWAGVWSLFTHFSIIFQPILMIGEPILNAFNLLPDSNVPIFK